jgi:hypothetical protein
MRVMPYGLPLKGLKRRQRCPNLGFEATATGWCNLLNFIQFQTAANISCAALCGVLNPTQQHHAVWLMVMTYS